MIRVLFLALSLFFSCQLAKAGDTTLVKLNELRDVFMKASYDKTLLSKVDSALLDYTALTAVKKAYEGAKIALTAREQWNPFEQVSVLKDGLVLINAAVASDPDNLEVRFIRFATLHHVPSFLGLSDNLPGDKTYIYNHISDMKKLGMTYEFSQSVYKFISNSGRFTEAEQQYFLVELGKVFVAK